jgi:hypothetical protein
MMNRLPTFGLIALLLFCLGINACAIEQVYDSDFGKIKLDLPIELVPKEGNTGTWIDLDKEGSEKPIISIRLQSTYGEDFEKYVASSGFKGTRIDSTNDDGNKLIFYSDNIGNDNQNQPVYHYTAFIDYLKDNGKIVQMWTYSEVHAKGESLARFNTDEAFNIARSFAVINDTEAQAITAKSATNQSPGFGSFFAIASLLGAIYVMRRLK